MRRYGVVGPPTLIFLRPGDGGEVTGSRSIGELTVEQMLQRLNFKPLNLS